MVRRNMSGLGEGGDVDTPNRYKEREAMIREAQQMVRKLYKEGFYQVPTTQRPYYECVRPQSRFWRLYVSVWGSAKPENG